METCIFCDRDSMGCKHGVLLRWAVTVASLISYESALWISGSWFLEIVITLLINRIDRI